MRDLAKSKLIHENAKACAGKYKHSEREFLAAVMEVERDRTFELHGCTYLTPYCVKELGIDEVPAECLVRIVRKSHDVPELFEAVMAGEIKLYIAKTICSVLTPENKDEWLQKAKTLRKKDLEREISKKNGVETKCVKLNLTFEAYENMERSRDLHSTKQAKYASLEETAAWGFEELVHRHDPVEKAKRAMAKSPTWQSESEVADQSGRCSQGHSLKHQVADRDCERCQWIYPDGSQCEERKWLHGHHIIHRKDAGLDTLENLITLCSGHHRIIHQH